MTTLPTEGTHAEPPTLAASCLVMQNLIAQMERTDPQNVFELLRLAALITYELNHITNQNAND